MRRRSVAKRSNVEDIVGRRVNDKLVAGMSIVIGAMAAILWGILWSKVQDHDGRILTLEKEGSSVSTTLKQISADIADVKLELRVQRGKVEK